MADLRPSGDGIGVLGVLFVIFVCAKVFGWEPVASWSFEVVPTEVWWIFGALGTAVVLLGIWYLFDARSL